MPPYREPPYVEKAGPGDPPGPAQPSPGVPVIVPVRPPTKPWPVGPLPLPEPDDGVTPDPAPVRSLPPGVRHG